jgi:cation diffusion facilitator CzcD-associated flavoprotein CzcO
VPKDQFAQYLEHYARALDLDVRLRQRVHRVARDDGGWRIDAEQASWTARAVVLATGRHRIPTMPTWPGRDTYGGRVLHSGEYRTGAVFAGQRVLIVGLGNSGAEIATDLVEQSASHVAVSVRTRPPIMPRDLFGFLPAQLIGLAATPIPAPRLLDRLGAVVRRIGSGDLSRYGLGPEAWGPLTARKPAVIDVGFLRALKSGRVLVRPNVARLTSDGVIFTDGRTASFDAVVAATGYRTALEQILALPDAITSDGRPSGRSGRETPFPGLYFIGYDETTRGVLHDANRDAKRLARLVARYLGGAR